VEVLLQRQQLHPNEGQLSIRILQESASVVAGHAIEQAQTSAQGRQDMPREAGAGDRSGGVNKL